MKYCVKCGNQLEDNWVNCPKCAEIQPEYNLGQQANPQSGGEPHGQYQNQNASQYQNPNLNQYGQYEQQKFNPTANAIPFLIWSIILLFFCMPLGLIATIFSAVSLSAKSFEEVAKNIKIAKILCIVGTCLFGLLIVLIILCTVLFFPMMSAFYSTQYY